MYFEHLQYMLTLERCGSIQRAAEELHITSQALGAALRHLERTLDVVLFERNHQGIWPTAAGQAVIAATSRYLEDCRALTQQYQQAPCKTTCAAVPYVVHLMLPEMISAYYRQHPLAQLLIQEHQTAYLLPAIQKGILEFAFYIQLQNQETQILQLPPQLQFVPLCSGRLVCYVPSSWPIAQQEAISLEQLFQYPLITPHLDDLLQFLELRASGSSVDRGLNQITAGDYYVMQEMVQEGLCAILALSWEAPLQQGVLFQNTVLLQVNVPVTAQFGYLKLAKHRFSAETAAFLHFTAQLAATAAPVSSA